MNAYRYLDRRLVPFPEAEDRPVVFEPVPPPRSDLWAATALVPDYQRRGLYMLDLARERARSGVPAWFKPNASRRGRCVAWNATPRRERERQRVAALGPVMEVRALVAHWVRRQTGPAPFPGAPPPHVEAALYLPQGEAPTKTHMRDMERALGR